MRHLFTITNGFFIIGLSRSNMGQLTLIVSVKKLTKTTLKGSITGLIVKLPIFETRTQTLAKLYIPLDQTQIYLNPATIRNKKTFKNHTNNTCV